MNRQNWIAVARGWEAHADAFRTNTMPVASWMVDAIAPQPGHTVLDLAAGIGDTGFLAAELIQPGGTLITSDFAPEMLAAAQRRAEALSIGNARFRQIDASQPIDLEAASVDGVLCRWGFMLMDDPEAAMRETRRVLRPGGRLALAAWTTSEENQWSARVGAELLSRGRVEPPPPGPGQFAWAREGVIAEHLEAAGFVEYEVDTLGFPIRYDSPEAWWETSKAMSMRTGEAAAAMDAAETADVVAALTRAAKGWTEPDGTLAIPARTWVAAATG